MKVGIQEKRSVEVVLRLMTKIGEMAGKSWREIDGVGKDAVVAGCPGPIARTHADGVDAGVSVAVGGGAALGARGQGAGVQGRRGGSGGDFKGDFVFAYNVAVDCTHG